MKKILLPLALCCVTSVAIAEDVEYGWSGSASAGLTMTSGNTDTTNAVLDAYIKNETERARHNYFANLLNAEDTGTKTGDRFLAGYKYDYKLSDVSYIWVEGRYEQDKFSSYENQLIGSTGYGRKVLNDDWNQLDIEAGIGYRTSDVREVPIGAITPAAIELFDAAGNSISGPVAPDPATPTAGYSEDEMVFRGAMFYTRKINDTASFVQNIVVISGSSNTAIDSKTAISAKVAGNIGLEAAYIVKHNTDVSVGSDKTDTTTALSLVYGF